MKKITYIVAALLIVFGVTAVTVQASTKSSKNSDSNPYPKTQEWINGIAKIDSDYTKQFNLLKSKATTTVATSTASTTAAIARVSAALSNAKTTFATGKAQFEVAKKENSSDKLNKAKATLQSSMEKYVKVADTLKLLKKLVSTATSTASH